jgi:hypothetical protein
VQEAGHLPNKYEALSANPSTDEKKRKEEGRGEEGREGKGGKKAWCQCLTPVILAPWEAEIRRIEV